MRLGVCWYPEQDPVERWSDDVRRMADAGLGIVRLGEFAWGKLQPGPGRWDLDWLARAVDTVGAAGLEVVVGTPTAVPPRWLVAARPEIRLIDADGQARAAGSRRMTCPTAPAYRDASRTVVAAIVDRLGAHEAVTGWQLDNEPGNHDSARCWCPACEAAFRTWVERRYGSLERLNDAWGTAFWSGQYGAWSELELPRPSSTVQSPSLLLAHRRFASRQVVTGLDEQRRIVRDGSPGRDILVNLYWDDTFVDARDVHGAGGIAAIDAYPHGVDGPEAYAYLLDLARGSAGPGGRAWVMEQQPGPINWTALNPPVPPGQVRLWGWQAALHGIEASLFFSWRPTRSGQEQYHSGLLRHDGSDDRGLAEARRLASELAAVAAADPAILARPRARVAILHAYEDAWTIEIDPHQAGLTHRALVQPVHAAVHRLGLDADLIGPRDDLTGYDVILAPALHITTDARVARLREAVAAGALVVLGVRSLVKDLDDCWAEVPLPGGLADDLGARVIEGLSQTLPVTVEPGDDPAGPWTDVLEADAPDVEVAARYGGPSYLAGAPAAVRRGGLAYVGFSSVEAWTTLLARWLPERGLEVLEPRPGVERFRRGTRRIVLDHGALTVDGLPAEVPPG
jgi:beta-galactosidase